MLTYDVRIYSLEAREDRRKPYRLIWKVGARRHSKSFALKAQADGRRSELMSAARAGEQFDTELGLPVSEVRAMKASITWYDHTLAFVDRKWANAPAKSRKNFADALATVTPVLVRTTTGRPDTRCLRRALYSHAYNVNARESGPPRPEWGEALGWMERSSVPISQLEDPSTLRAALDALALKLDGSPAAVRTFKRKRACLSDALGMAAEKGYFSAPVNPLTSLRSVPRQAVEQVDPESVANPRQVRSLLKAVVGQGARGRHLEAFFGCLYYAAMRPAEASNLRLAQCHLPESGWGSLNLRKGVVRSGRSWTDDGRAHEERGLKARPDGDTRPVPIPPAFVRMLRAHVSEHGTAPDGRLFRTLRGGFLQESGYGEVWADARRKALAPEEFASPLARRPYDLRHAGISFWLSSGVDPAECARRAGHSLSVMFRVYAKVLAQAEDRANRRIEAAMREWDGG